MDKRPSTDKRFYELTYQRAEGGAPAVRLYSIKCAECKVLHELKPGSASDEAIRRGLIRKGWSIGRFASQNTCPACLDRHKDNPDNTVSPAAMIVVNRGGEAVLVPEFSAASTPGEPEPEPELQKPFLLEVWEQSSEDERMAFINALGWCKPKPPPIVQEAPRLRVLTPHEMLASGWNKLTERESREWLVALMCGTCSSFEPVPQWLLQEAWKATPEVGQINFMGEMLDMMNLYLADRLAACFPDMATPAPLTSVEDRQAKSRGQAAERQRRFRERQRVERAQHDAPPREAEAAPPRNEQFLPTWSDDEISTVAKRLFG